MHQGEGKRVKGDKDTTTSGTSEIGKREIGVQQGEGKEQGRKGKRSGRRTHTSKKGARERGRGKERRGMRVGDGRWQIGKGI